MKRSAFSEYGGLLEGAPARNPLIFRRGYLVGTLDRFNNAKRAEVADRVKHMHLGTA